MRCRNNTRPAAGLASLLIAFVVIGPAALAAGAPADSSQDDESTPQLTVRVYSSVRVSPWLLQMSESEAARLLREVRVNFIWVNCTSPPASAVCMSDLAATDLVVRLVKNALPQASTDALGIAGGRGDDAIAFVFYGRVIALRSQTRSLHAIVGRVLAHEIVHMLLPDESHSDFGLMRGLWSADDLRSDSSACLGLPIASVQLMQKEALRRVVSERNLALK